MELTFVRKIRFDRVWRLCDFTLLSLSLNKRRFTIIPSHPFPPPRRGKLKRNMAGYGNSRSTIVAALSALGKTFNSISRMALSRP